MSDFTRGLLDADDDTLRAALNDAHIATLLMVLVHLTGDLTLLRDDLAPAGAILGDPQGGVSDEAARAVRERAFAIIAAFRDAGAQPPPVPDDAAIQRMLKFMTGRELRDEYARFLEAELGLHGEDPFQPESFGAVPEKARAAFPVLIIGAGMSGLLAAIRLSEAGLPWTIVEKNADVGGTWFENTYPGCRVDSPNHTYSYSFAPNDWPQHFSEQKVLREYFAQCADRYGLRDGIRFGTEVIEARYDEDNGCWRIRLQGPEGEEIFEARALISAVGQLSRPKLPDLPGIDEFRGDSFHSQRWDHDCDLTGKRVAVIGTGASAFQFIPRIAEVAESVTVFQRTPPWCAPTPEYQDYVPAGKHWLLNHLPFYAKWFRFWNFWTTAEGLLDAVTIDPAWNEAGSVSAENQALREMLTAYTQEIVGDDPELFAKVVPAYPPGGKRMLRDDGLYLRTLRRDDVHLVTDPIAAVTDTGLRTESGADMPFDVIIYGTGFHADRFLWPMKVFGTGGRELHDVWNGDPRAYLGVTVPGFPNLFCMYGPNTNIVVNGSIVFFSECEIRYILGCIRLLLAEDKTALDCRQEVHDAYNARIDEHNAAMAWGSPHVSSWYKNAQGRVTQNWPYSLLEFWTRTREPDRGDYRLIG